MKRIILLFLVGACTLSCSKEQAKEHSSEPISKAQLIVDKSIQFHSLNGLEDAEFNLDFRDIHYTYYAKNGIYQYTRTQTDSLGRTVYDVLNNESLTRLIDGDTADIEDEKRAAYSRSVNSVIYFFRLPYGLNDPAVQKKYNGEKDIKGKTYHEVEIRFAQEGGGEDYDDVFLYWFDKEDYSMDFIAYLYHTDGGGMRFREAINMREIKNTLIQDYINFKPENEDIDINTIRELYNQDSLIELSRIINEKVDFTFY